MTLIRPTLLAMLLWAGASLAGSGLGEVTVGKDHLALAAQGELTVQPDTLFLTGSYSFVRSGADTPLSHQLGIGLDAAVGLHGLFTSTVQWGPPVLQKVPLTSLIVYRSVVSHLGAAVGGAWQSGGFSDWEFAFDAQLSGTVWDFTKELHTARATFRRPSALGILRPDIGATLIFRLDTEVTVGGAYDLYSADPLTTGRFTEAQLSNLETSAQRRLSEAGLDEARIQSALQALEGRLSIANAVSGLPSAPVRYELRAQVRHAFGRAQATWGQLGYDLLEYVPGQGLGHVFSTKWTFQLTDAFRIWTALALQRDLGGGHAPLDTWLVTVGGEVAP